MREQRFRCSERLVPLASVPSPHNLIAGVGSMLWRVLQRASIGPLSVRPTAASRGRRIVCQAAKGSEPGAQPLPPRRGRRPIGGWRDEEHLARWGPRRFTDEELKQKMLYIGIPAWFVEQQFR